MAVKTGVYSEFGCTPKNTTGAVHLWLVLRSWETALYLDGDAQRYESVIEFVYIGDATSNSADIFSEILRRIRFCGNPPEV